MADVAITKSKSITIRGGQIPSNPVIPETPEDPVTIPSTPPHNNLSGLQGGVSGEYYHLTNDEYDAVLGSNSPDAGNPFATMADVGGGSDLNKVSYNVADGKTESEQLQARNNIGSTSSTPQVIAASGAINDLAITSNHLVFTGATVVLSGISQGLDGQEITILNANAVSMSILSQSVLSLANNRIIGDVSVSSFSIVRLKYRTTTNRWLLENVGINDARYLRKDKSDNTAFGLGVGMTSSIGTNTILARSITSGQNPFFTLQYAGGSSAVVQRNDGRFQIFNLTGSARHALEVDGSIGTGGAATFQGVGPTISGNRAVFSVKHTNANNRRTIEILNSSDVRTVEMYSEGNILHARSTSFNESVRRDELPFNYPQTVATGGTINDLSLGNEGIKLLILSAATDLTGVLPVTTTTGRLLRIESRVAGGVIIRHESASSTAANRFTLPGAVDLTIANGEVYTFIYTNGRWRRVF